jgi:heme exporter protein B
MRKRNITLPGRSAHFLTKAYAVFAKDLRLELRSKYALNTILMFGVISLVAVSFSLGQSSLPPKLLAAVFWIIMFFAAMAGLAHVFVREEESGTALALRLTADPDTVYLGKLVFNLTLLSLMAAVITPLFFMFTDAPSEHWASFVLVLALGVLALCAGTTLVGAIVSKASVKGALFAVLSLPIFLVPLWWLVAASDKALTGGGFAAMSSELSGLFSYCVVMITLSVLMFKIVWLE